MRILYITDALAIWGGIERVLRDKANYLVDNYNYDIHIVTTDQGSHPIPYPMDARVTIHDLNINHHDQYQYHGIKRLLKYKEKNRLFQNRLKKYIHEIKPDVIVCIRIDSIRTIINAKGDIPLVCESHSMFYAYKHENTSVLNKLYYLLLRKSIRKADCIVTLTEGDAKDWQQYNKNVRTIPNIVQLNPIGEYSCLQSKKAIFVGRFSQQKDIGSLIEIWKEVHKLHPDWELCIYGEGELKNHYVEMATKANANISIYPPTSDIFLKYIESSMLIMTSRYEPFGLVLPEAMSCGLPVIAFNCPYGPADIIKNEENGFLIDNRDTHLYARKICQLIEDEKLRMELGHNAILSSQRYQADKIMPLWKQLFEQISK